jgi:hypothetical protein
MLKERLHYLKVLIGERLQGDKILPCGGRLSLSLALILR